MNNTVKIEKLQNAIEAIRALGEGYEGIIEKLQNEIAEVMQAEKQTKKQDQRKRATVAYNAAKSNEADYKRQITALKRKLTMARNKATGGCEVSAVKVTCIELELSAMEHALLYVWTDYNSIMAGL